MATSVADAVPSAPNRSGHNGRVIHVRIVSTPELLEPMLRRVEADDAVVNIVVVEGVCRRPYGHLVLLDVTEEAAHQLLDALEQLGLTESGSVALEHAPFTVSRAAEQAEAGAPGHPEEAVIWDEVLVRARSDATLTLSLVVFMVIAAVIAAVGILTDSPILIVGAMVVSPDFNPISALTVALFLGQRPLAGRAAATLAWGFLFAVAATMVLTFVVEAIDRVPEVFAFDERILTSFISRPNGFSAVVALMAGTAGALSITESKAATLVGVFISVTTIPAVAAMGVHLAAGNWERAWGATLQLVINTSCLVLAGWITMWVQRRLLARMGAGSG